MANSPFFPALNSAIKNSGSVLCAGIDPSPAIAGDEFLNPERLFSFCEAALDAMQGKVACIKPNIAFFEQYGFAGVKIFSELCKSAAEKNLLVIADIKRGDIGSTSEAYAKAYLDFTNPYRFKVDAVTVSPFLGLDTLEPFYGMAEKNGCGIFVLLRTSNLGALHIQGSFTDAASATSRVADWLREKSGKSRHQVAGAVVGATSSLEAAELRQALPEVPFLIPGYGAQGASAFEATRSIAGNKSGVINASRSLFAGANKLSSLSEISSLISENIERANTELNKALEE